MLTSQLVRNLAAKLAVVPFFALGGSCTGIEQALSNQVYIAVNPE